MDEDYLFEFIRILPKNGEWQFERQRENWLCAISFAVDMVLDRRKLATYRRQLKEQAELAEIKDIGSCGYIEAIR